MISNLFYAFGKQEELQSRVKGQIPKKELQVRTRGLSMFGEVRLKIHFCVENQSAILFQSLWFHAKNWIIGYRYSLWKYVDRINRISTQFAI